jgi:UDPglucose--hexose-1-phosphate uridylyltransferase
MERRYDAFSGEWRSFAEARQDRTFLPSSSECPLCPSDENGDGGEIPRTSFDIVTFDNRFPTFTASPPAPSIVGTDLTPVAPAIGAAEVVVWSADHNVTLADLPVERLARLVDVWAERYADLAARAEVAYVLTFENHGTIVGATLSHPHGQIYAYPEVPPRVRAELLHARDVLATRGTCVRCETGTFELREGARLVADDGTTTAFVPFAARFPYEVQIQPRRHATSLLDLADGERMSLASVLHDVLVAYNALFDFPLPYVLALHQAPTVGPDWLRVSHAHIELTPLHRDAAKLKYLAGSEIAAGAFVSDVAPERSAGALRAAKERAISTGRY